MAPIHLAILVPGWRCADRVAACWASLVAQEPGDYSWEAHFYDDGSGDETWPALCRLPRDERLHRYHAPENLGAAHARRFMLWTVTDPEAVCVLLDMDDTLEPGALARVAQEYQAHPETWLTYGSAISEESGRVVSRPYPADVVQARAYRSHLYLAAPLRTFRRHLADGVPNSYLQDVAGRWLMAGTDLALMWALLELCPPERVRHIPDPIYRYARHPMGTSVRFDAAYKAGVRAHLASLPPLPLKESHA